MKPEKLKEFLEKGAVLVVQLTPFTESDEIDVEGLRENTRFLVDKGKQGSLALVPTGSTGEFYALNDKEKKKVVETVIEEANGKVPVIVGTGAAGTKLAIENSKYAEDVGADGVMVVLPYYHVPEEEGMYLHYKKVAEAVDIGIVVYNNPDVSKVYIQPHLMKRIAEIPNVVGVKENTPSVSMFHSQVKTVGDRIPIIQGRGEWWFAVTALLGTRGFVSGYANFMPEFSLDLLKAGLNGDFVKVKKLVESLEPLEEFNAKMSRKYGPSTSFLPYPYMSSYMFFSVMKAAMDILGLRGGHMRLPLTNITEEDKEELKKILFEKLGLNKIN